MVHVDHIAKEPPQPLNQLGGQGNLWDQKQHLLSRRKHLRDEVRVNLRFPGSCHAVEEHGLLGDQSRVHGVVGPGLCVREHGKACRARTTGASGFALFHLEDAAFHPFLDRRGVCAGSLLGLHLGQLPFFHDRQQQTLHRHGFDPGPRQGR